MANSRNNSGVTLVEMLVVLGIILVLSGIVVSVTLRVDSQAKENALRNAFALVGSSLREYYEFKGQFPPQPERNSANALAHVELLLQELRSVPAARQVLDKINVSLIKSEGGPTDAQSLRDPWGTVLDYVYTPGNACAELISAGPDRQFGTGDDLTSKGKR
jgi:prepilin-type N-terminal cleavage/methylation domain-containing protein